MLKYTLGVDKNATFLPCSMISPTRYSIVAGEYQYWLKSPFSLNLVMNTFFFEVVDTIVKFDAKIKFFEISNKLLLLYD